MTFLNSWLRSGFGKNKIFEIHVLEMSFFFLHGGRQNTDLDYCVFVVNPIQTLKGALLQP